MSIQQSNRDEEVSYENVNDQSIEINEHPVHYNDTERRNAQIEFVRNDFPQDGAISKKQRQQTIACYSIGTMLIILTPYHSCNEAGNPSKYYMDIKEWIIIYFILNIVQLCRFFLF